MSTKVSSNPSYFISKAVNSEFLKIIASLQCVQYIYKRDLESCPIFGRLKSLLLDMWCRTVDMHALVRILQHTPILEKLTLQLRSDEVDFLYICYHYTSEWVMYIILILLMSCVLQNFLNAGRGERKHVRIAQSFVCAHLKEVNIECEEKLRVKDKVRQIVKILNRGGIRTEQISFKKIPRPEGCKLTTDFILDSRVSNKKNPGTMF